MSFWKLLSIGLKRSFSLRILMVLLLASLLLFPAFAMDNSTISKNISNNYYIADTQPQNNTLINSSLCFLLIGGDLRAQANTEICFNISAGVFFNGMVSIRYFTNSTGDGRVFINTSTISTLVFLKLNIKGSASTSTVFLKSYSINSFKVLKGGTNQNDVIFSFNRVYLLNNHLKRETIYYCSLPSEYLGFYGFSEVFYTVPSQNYEYNVSLELSGNSEKSVPIVTNGTPGILYSIAEPSILAKLNQNGYGLFSINHLANDHSTYLSFRIYIKNPSISSSNTPGIYFSVGSAGMIAFSSISVALLFIYFQRRGSANRFLSLPLKRTQFVLSDLLSSILFMTFISLISFMFLDSYWKIAYGDFLSFFAFFYVAVSDAMILFAISSIYLLMSGRNMHRITSSLTVFFTLVIPFLNLLASAYFYIFTSGSISGGATYITAPMGSYSFYFNIIRDIIPVESGTQMNKYLVNSPILGIKMLNNTGLLGMEPVIIFLSCLIISSILFIAGTYKYSRMAGFS